MESSINSDRSMIGMRGHRMSPRMSAICRSSPRSCYLAATLGWEGDIREGPFTTMLRDPDDRGGSSTRAIAFKQDNNGVTFVAVHSALHWLFREYGGSAVVTWHPPIRPPPVMATHDRIIALERPRCRGIAGAIGV